MNANIMIEDVKLAHFWKVRIEAEIKRDRFDQQRAAWECLKFFESTPVTKADFRMRFASMAAEDVTLLKAFYNVKTNNELLEMIYHFWDVKI